ncbi:hypothetical protein NDU88_007383 [Pleurodeles waltl]|uniref:Uncharacterized protein n=1 Tax=Pleurodeles waltl TaxID=8319 RepID=A0AAV7QKL1_PLEWA|nr:hypothetical protein NDU88_007383 [Pleurodeles waltl]
MAKKVHRFWSGDCGQRLAGRRENTHCVMTETPQKDPSPEFQVHRFQSGDYHRRLSGRRENTHGVATETPLKEPSPELQELLLQSVEGFFSITSPLRLDAAFIRRAIFLVLSVTCHPVTKLI